MLFSLLNLNNQRSSVMVSACFRILKNNKKLLLFPFISLLCCAIAIISFIFPAFAGMSYILHNNISGYQFIISIVVILFVFYTVIYFIMTFFNAAFLFCVDSIICKKPVSLCNGIKAATACLPVIFAWSLIAATVGMILSLLEKRSNRGFSIARTVLGVSWSIITFLALPVLIFENKGPFAAIKDSIKSMKNKWGDGVRLGLNLYVYFLIPHLLFAGLLGYGIYHQITALIILGGFGIFACLFLYSAVCKIAEVIFYQYLKNGQLPSGCSQQEINSIVN